MEPITAIAVSGDGDHLVVGTTIRDLAIHKIEDGTLVRSENNAGKFTHLTISMFQPRSHL